MRQEIIQMMKVALIKTKEAIFDVVACYLKQFKLKKNYTSENNFYIKKTCISIPKSKNLLNKF